MIKQKGFIGLGAIIAIIAVVVAAYVAYNFGKNKTPTTIPPTTTTENHSTTQEVPTGPFINSTNYVPPSPLCASNTSPWIKVTSPNGGETYTAGQQITVKWKSCNVQNVYIGLASGGKDFGELTPDGQPISASQDSLQWTASNPAKDFTESSINSYQIVIQSQAPDVTVRSGTFSVQ
jgi:hypothetical protein